MSPDELLRRLLGCVFADTGGLSDRLRQRRPLLDVAEWTSTYHSHHQLAALALAEARESRIREAENRRRERVILLVTVAAAWLGFTQVWEAVVAAQPESVRGAGWWTVSVLMFAPALLAGPVIWLLVRGGWALAERMRAGRAVNGARTGGTP